MGRIVIVMAFLAAAIPAYAQTFDRSNGYKTTTDVKKIGWMDRGMDAVRNKLKDPKSAEFSDVYFNRGKDNIPLTCGTVNAKNSLGGRGGPQRFISGGTSDLTFLEEETQDFSVSWDRFCK